MSSCCLSTEGRIRDWDTARDLLVKPLMVLVRRPVLFWRFSLLKCLCASCHHCGQAAGVMLGLGSGQALAAQVKPGAASELVPMQVGTFRMNNPTGQRVQGCAPLLLFAGKTSCSARAGLLLPVAVWELLTTWSVT